MGARDVKMAQAYLRRVIADLSTTQQDADGNAAILRTLSLAYYELAMLDSVIPVTPADLAAHDQECNLAMAKPST